MIYYVQQAYRYATCVSWEHVFEAASVGPRTSAAGEVDGYVSVHPFIDANPINGHGWWTQCVLGAGTDRKPFASCDVHTYVGSTYTSEYDTPLYPAQYDTWYTLRIEADPATAHLRFYLDGKLIGEHTPNDAAALVAASNFRPDVSIWNGDANAVATRYVDDVRITPAQ